MAFHIRYNAAKASTLHRGVITLLEAAGVFDPFADKPDRVQKRLEKALDQLVSDGVIAGWRYGNKRTLPARKWLDYWLQSTIEIDPPPYAYRPHTSKAVTDKPGKKLRCSTSL